jgi:hypothetical protein
MCCNVNWSVGSLSDDRSEERNFTAPCSHLVVYETDLGGRSVFLRTKVSFAGCFPLDALVIEDDVSSSELSSVRSERSVNSRSADVDMTSESERDEGASGILQHERCVTVGRVGRVASVATKLSSLQSFISPSPPHLSSKPCGSRSSFWRALNLIPFVLLSPAGIPRSMRSPASTVLASPTYWMPYVLS